MTLSMAKVSLYITVTLYVICLEIGLTNTQMSEPIIYRFEEESETGTVLGNLISDTNMDKTIGFDEATQLKFRVVTKPKSEIDYIKVGETSGLVRINGIIDRERICPLKDTCELEYGVVVSPNKYFRIIKILLIIVDLNDHAPTFPSDDMVLSISESTVPGTFFSIPSAEDLDGGEFGIKQHELISDTKAFEMKVRAVATGKFEIKIQLVDQLDREETDKFELKIVVRDGGTPPQQGTINIHIKVEDSNDHEPEFDPASYEETVVENITIGTTVTRVRAHDRDEGLNGQIRYSFSSQTRQDYGDIFDIDARTGDVVVRGYLDFETRPLYVLTVVAHDQGSGPLSSQTNVVIHVQDVNDKPPEVSVNYLNPTGAEILENVDPGTFVAHLSVTDDDQGSGGTFSCRIESGDFEIKKIAEDQYGIYSRRRFDREHKSRYEFPIVCTDNGYPPLTTTQNMVVQIGDVNDHAPHFHPESVHVSVVENRPAGFVLLQMNASDEDTGRNARLLYRLSSDATDKLRIDQRSGVITTNKLLDHEEIQEFTFVVYVEDRGEPVMTSSASVHITVLDQDDELPHFERAKYTFTVAENQNPGTIVGTITAHDYDSVPYNDFRYELESHLNKKALFQLNAKTGELSTTVELDRETASSYNLIATATPTGNPSQASECNIVIEIGDVNDNPPVFQFPLNGYNDTVQLKNHIPVGQTIAILRAQDPDANNNADLMFAIVGGNDENVFSIDSSNGHVLLYKDMSRFMHKMYKLTVEVKDKGDPQLSDTSTLYVIIENSSTERVVVKEQKQISFLQSNVLTVILAVTAGILLVLIVIAVIIIIFCRKNKRNASPSHDNKECQRMLQHNTGHEQFPLSQDCHGNSVTVVDLCNIQKSKPPIRTEDANIPLTVDLLSNHPVAKADGTRQCNGCVKKFSTCGYQSNGSNNLNGYNKNQSREFLPSRDHSSNGYFLQREKLPALSSNISGKYMHYDSVDSDV